MMRLNFPNPNLNPNPDPNPNPNPNSECNDEAGFVTINPGLVGLCLSYVVVVTSTLNWGVRNVSGIDPNPNPNPNPN